MTLKETLLKEIGSMPTTDQARILEYVRRLKSSHTDTDEPSFHDGYGLLAQHGIDISEQDLADARSEMWGDYTGKDH